MIVLCVLTWEVEYLDEAHESGSRYCASVVCKRIPLLKQSCLRIVDRINQTNRSEMEDEMEIRASWLAVDESRLLCELVIGVVVQKVPHQALYCRKKKKKKKNGGGTLLGPCKTRRGGGSRRGEWKEEDGEDEEEGSKKERRVTAMVSLTHSLTLLRLVHMPLSSGAVKLIVYPSPGRIGWLARFIIHLSILNSQVARKSYYGMQKTAF